MPMAFRGLGRPTDQLDISIAPAEAQGTFAPMPAPAPQAQSGGFFGEGGTGRAIAGYLGDALAQMGGVQPVYAQALAAKREENQYQRQLADRWGLWKQQQDYERANPAPQVINTGDGGIASVKGDQVSMIRQPDPPQPGEQERMITLYASLPDSDPRKPLIERAIRGYQYTAPAIAAKTEAATTLEGVRQGNRVQLKGMTGGGGGRRASKPPAGFILDN